MSERIAVIFDFDNTLAEDSTSAYLKKYNINVQNFWQCEVDSLVKEGWNPITAYMYLMLKKRQNNPELLTQESLSQFSSEITLFPGVRELFSKIKSHIKEKNERFSVEFYIISSGIQSIINHCIIRDEFKEVWCSEFSFDNEGIPFFIKNVINFTDKTRYLFQIQKGIIGPFFKNKPFMVNNRVLQKDIYIPFDQMIFIGDGYTDIPCFSMMQKFGGTSICVYEPSQPSSRTKAWGFVKEGRVLGSLPADYREGSALYYLILDSISHIIETKAVMSHQLARSF